MDQVYLFYEKCKKIELDNERRSAITLAQSLIYTSPVHEKSDLKKRQQNWDRFLDSLNINKLKNKKKEKKQTVKDVKKMFRELNFNIPIIKQPKKLDKGD